jgi:DNA-binding NarL/FixJ family response regulator
LTVIFYGSEFVGQNKQLSAVLLGTSLHFSNPFIRVLGSEFPEVQFVRQGDISGLRDISPPPRLVVVHESLPDPEQAVQAVRAQLPDAIVAVASTDLSQFPKSLSSESARSVGLLPLNTPIDVWLSILKLLLCGHAYVPAEVFCAQREGSARQSEIPVQNETGATVCLTPREMEILPFIAQGLQNKVIAGTFGLSEHTVKLHTHNIFSKLGVSNRTAAAKWYLSQVAQKVHSDAAHDH